MSEVIYGRNPILEAIRSGRSVEKLFVAEEIADPKITEIINLARNGCVAIEKVSKKKLVELAGTAHAQGVVALIRSQPYASLEEILSRSTELNEPLLVTLLDGIEDPHNLGAIIRSAEGAGLHGVVVPKRRSAGLSSTVAKTSAGASNYVLTAQVSNLNYTIDKLKQQNIWVVGAEQTAKQSYIDADLSGPVAIVIGAEGRGLHRLVRERCDFLVSIPMYGRMNSLNASVAAALLFFEARRQRQLKL